MGKKKSNILLISLLILIFFQPLFSAEKGTIKGKIVDVNSGQPLPGTNVVIPKYNIGTAADVEGDFTLRNVPAEKLKLKVSFIGYESKTVDVEVNPKEIIQKKIELRNKSIEGQEVEIKAQAKGQMDAINEQLSSSSITDNVSSSKIRSLPDANAAESVGRLPGVSIKRTGGEGSKVVIRGLSPKYTKINVEGTQMASTSSEDRSVDLSMISSNLLSGIEVQKSSTASQEGDAMGGIVNFKVREATSDLNYEILTEGGYNGLRNEVGDYKVMASLDNRYFDDNLGILVQLTNEEKTLDAENLTAGYTNDRGSLDEEIDSAKVTNVNLEDVYRNRRRLGGAFVADYKTSYTKMKFTNFLNRGETKTRRYSRGFEDNGTERYVTGYEEQELFTMVNSFGLEQTLPKGDLNLKISRSQSKREIPVGGEFSFWNRSGLVKPQNKYKPIELAETSKETFENQTLGEVPSDISDNNEVIWTFSGDYRTSYSLSETVSGELEIGGMYKQKYREYNENHYLIPAWLGSSKIAKNYLISYFDLNIPYDTEDLPIEPFLSNEYSNEDFLEGKYDMRNYADIDIVKETLKNLAKDNLPDSIGTHEIRPEDVQSNANDYSGNEYYSAAYIETKMDIGEKIDFMPGLRYERNVTKYTGERGDATGGAANVRNWKLHHDTTSTRSNEFFLPSIQLKISPVEWWDVRLGYTESISRPDYRDIIPNLLINSGYIEWGNVNLNPSHSKNYDIRFSFHSDRLGLISVGGFYKTISDQIFNNSGRLILNREQAEQYEGISEWAFDGDIVGNQIYTSVNNEYDGELYGLELNFQNQFWYLPGPLGGLVFNGNYTYINSEARYPYTEIGVDYTTGDKYTKVDTSYKSRLIDQPENILNLAFGYDYKGFSGRISMRYKSNIFSRNNFWPELRGQTAGLTRWDLSFKQDLPIQGLECRFSIENITNEIDKNVIKYTKLPSARENYGRYMTLALNYKM